MLKERKGRGRGKGSAPVRGNGEGGVGEGKGKRGKKNTLSIFKFTKKDGYVMTKRRCKKKDKRQCLTLHYSLSVTQIWREI